MIGLYKPAFPVNTERSAHVLGLGYFIFFASLFLIPDRHGIKTVFLYAVFFPGIFYFKKVWQAFPRDRFAGLLVLFIFWTFLSGSWSEDVAWKPYSKLLVYCLFLLMFFAVTAYLVCFQKPLLLWLMGGIVVLSGLVALFSIPWWYSSQSFPVSRMVAWGAQENPNTSVMLHGWAALLGSCFLIYVKPIGLRGCFALAILANLAVVVLTQSNTGMLATGVALSLFFLLSARVAQNRLLLMFAVLFGIATVIALLYSFGMLGGNMDRGFIDRIPRWQATWGLISESPLLGGGQLIANQLLLADGSIVEKHAHSAFLATARDGGLIGFLLLVSLLGLALLRAWRAVRMPKTSFYLAFLLLPLVAMLAEVDQLIAEPSYIWVFFWWPLAILMAHTQQHQAAIHA